MLENDKNLMGENSVDLTIQPKEKPEKKKSRARKVFKTIFFLILTIVLLPFLIIYYSIRAIVKHNKKKKWEREGLRGEMLLLSANMSDIDLMEGYAFEEYLKTLFFYDGYKTEVTQKAKDYGADIILEKDGITTVVQAKRYNKGVGISSVQQAIGAKNHYGASEAMVVTSSYFTSEAELLAKENGVRLVDREELLEIQTRVKEHLNITTKDSELINKKDIDIEQKYPFMI